MGNRHKDYDELVERYGFNKMICPNVSKHWGNQIPSDMLFDMWTMYITRSYANKYFKESFAEMRNWGPVECAEFYSTRLQTTTGAVRADYKLDNDNAILSDALGRANPESQEVLIYRWNNGYVFTDYAERIQIAMDRKAQEDGAACFNEISKIETLLKEKDALASGIEELSNNPRIDKRLRAMLKNMDVTIADVIDSDGTED
jgi:hypothetical protein